MNQASNQSKAVIATYDDEAEASGWYGPEVIFGLMYHFVKSGESIMDIGIGTGLASVLFRKAGLKVHGMDGSPQMLDACRHKGFEALKMHDLSHSPYPYDSESMHHVVSTGVFNFFSDLSLVFEESARILRQGGLFAFTVGDRTGNEPHAIKVGAEHTRADQTITMYLHSTEQIETWMKESGFRSLRSLAFQTFVDRERKKSIQAKAYLARKIKMQ
jgi:predicted TPR repeat methyltransferase